MFFIDTVDLTPQEISLARNCFIRLGYLPPKGERLSKRYLTNAILSWDWWKESKYLQARESRPHILIVKEVTLEELVQLTNNGIFRIDIRDLSKQQKINILRSLKKKGYSIKGPTLKSITKYEFLQNTPSSIEGFFGSFSPQQL